MAYNQNSSDGFFSIFQATDAAEASAESVEEKLRSTDRS